MSCFYLFSDIGPYGSKFSIDDVKKSMDQTGVGLKGIFEVKYFE